MVKRTGYYVVCHVCGRQAAAWVKQNGAIIVGDHPDGGPDDENCDGSQELVNEPPVHQA
jgi:hypothetical protein